MLVWSMCQQRGEGKAVTMFCEAFCIMKSRPSCSCVSAGGREKHMVHLGSEYPTVFLSAECTGNTRGDAHPI